METYKSHKSSEPEDQPGRVENRRPRRRRRKRSFFEIYKFHILIAAIALIVIIVCLVLILGRGKKKKDVDLDDIGETQTTTELVTSTGEPVILNEGDVVNEDGTITTAEGAIITVDGEVIQAAPNLLKENEYPEINTLIETYYGCIASGDVDGIRAIVDELSADEESYISSLTTLIDSYQNIVCYTKNGMNPDEYLVFVRYDLKFRATDTLAPGVEAYYVMKDEPTGNYFLYLSEPGSELIAFVNSVVGDDDVQALYAEVDEAFAVAKAEDEKLSEYGSKLEELNQTGEAPVEEAPQQTEEAPQQPAGPDTTATATASNRETRMGGFTGAMKVRADRSTDASVVGNLYKGDKVTVLEDYSDGWSHIKATTQEGNAIEGYVKTEYIE